MSEHWDHLSIGDVLVHPVNKPECSYLVVSISFGYMYFMYPNGDIARTRNYFRTHWTGAGWDIV